MTVFQKNERKWLNDKLMPIAIKRFLVSSGIAILPGLFEGVEDEYLGGY